MPFWRLLWARVERRLAPIEDRLNGLEARLASLDARLQPSDGRVAALEAAWRQHVPSFLNAVGTVGAFGHEMVQLRRNVEAVGPPERIDTLAARLESIGTRVGKNEGTIGSLWERIEFVRREILFEMQHGDDNGSRQAGQARESTMSPRVVAFDKVAAAMTAGSLRVNLGCGHIALPDYVNVDMRELPGVDVVAQVELLPFEAGSVDEIYSAHLLEHFPQEAIRRRLLPYWSRLLRPGGRFRAVTPDAAAMLAAAGSGNYPFEDFREVVFGAQDYAGDYHYNLFTPDSLGALLAEAGFTDITVPVAGRRNGKCFEFEIAARRP